MFWWSGGLKYTPKNLRKLFVRPPFHSKALEKSKSGSQIEVFLPLGAMFGPPGHGPKISKVSLWHLDRLKTT